MTPPCVVFPASKLPQAVQADLKGKKRKVEGGGDIDLSKCALRSMVQYRCVVQNPKDPKSPVGCWPVQRLFRQCQDKKGTFTVETTAWEGPEAEARARAKASAAGNRGRPDNDKGKDMDGDQHKYHQWSQAWEEE